MPRVRSAAAQVAGAQPPITPQLAAATVGVGGLALADAGCSAADAAANSFAEGRLYRAYGHDARIFGLGFHPTSSDLLVSASDDCTAGVWRRQQGSPTGGARYMQVACFRGHGDSVMRAAWSPDGHMVASGSSDGVVCLWQPTEAAFMTRHNLGTGGTEHLASLEGHPEEVYACIFLHHHQQQHGGSTLNGGSGTAGQARQRLVSASGESLFLWDIPTQRLLQQVPSPPMPQVAAAVPERWRPGYLFGVAAQPDGPLLGAACSDGQLRLWAREGGDSAITPLCTLPWNQAMGADCCFAPGGVFCACSKDGSLIIIDVRQGRCLQHLQLDAPLLSCTLLHDSSTTGSSSQVLVAAGTDGAVHFVDVATGGAASLFPEAAPLRPLLCAALSLDGTSLAASGEAVQLGEDDLLGGNQPEAGMGLGRHQPAPKWSPMHVWQRSSKPAPVRS